MEKKMKKLNLLIGTAMLAATPTLTLAQNSGQGQNCSGNTGVAYIACTLQTQVGSIVDLVMLISLLVGLFIIMNGIFGMKKAAESNGQQGVTYGQALTKIAIGTMLMTPQVFIALFSQSAYGGAGDTAAGQFEQNLKNFGIDRSKTSTTGGTNAFGQ